MGPPFTIGRRLRLLSAPNAPPGLVTDGNGMLPAVQPYAVRPELGGERRGLAGAVPDPAVDNTRTPRLVVGQPLVPLVPLSGPLRCLGKARRCEHRLVGMLKFNEGGGVQSHPAFLSNHGA